jgi:DegV family protein with EDD domain
MSVRIVTDSTCDLPDKVVQELGITVIPIHIHSEGKDLRDGIDLSREDFYRRLPILSAHPTTAVPSADTFANVYQALASDGATEVLSIHISQTLSGITNVASVAASEFTSLPVKVFDSGQLSLGTGFLAQTAAKLALAGKTLKEILPELENQARRTYVAAGLDTLKYLHLSGRMHVALSTIGEIIQLKPILWMRQGVSSVERVRTKKKAIARLVEMMQKNSPLEQIAILHSGMNDAVHELVDQANQIFDGDIWIDYLNPVIGTHIGPGVVGFACVSTSEK